jgi:hypothetical protein
MLYICLPVYNTDVTRLANELLEQSKDSAVELLIVDDCSTNHFKDINSEFCQDKDQITYISLPNNIGRSAIRNYFLGLKSKGHFLFLDGDSIICRSNFISTYIELIQQKNPDLAYGGSCYQKNRPSRNFMLRWKYSTSRESRSLDFRLKNSHGFKTNNFLINIEVFNQYPFNENLKGYGHEDTLFGFQLFQKGIKPLQIENPVLNEVLDENIEFLAKTNNAIDNLVMINSDIESSPEFVAHVKLLSAYYTLKKKNLLFLFNTCYFLASGMNNILLKKGYFFLWMFDAYKLQRISKAFKAKALA